MTKKIGSYFFFQGQNDKIVSESFLESSSKNLFVWKYLTGSNLKFLQLSTFFFEAENLFFRRNV
jgi:hypothetical protein